MTDQQWLFSAVPVEQELSGQDALGFFGALGPRTHRFNSLTWRYAYVTLVQGIVRWPSPQVRTMRVQVGPTSQDGNIARLLKIMPVRQPPPPSYVLCHLVSVQWPFPSDKT
jgi:hypothetical protein